tara:strand:- start:600 stop:920 length:321 start_codon:yes stop_codon:yes gene_type:complete
MYKKTITNQEVNMKHAEKIANKIIKFAKKDTTDHDIDYSTYSIVSNLLNHHQFRAVQIVLDGIDSYPRDEILNIIQTDDKVWNTMFKPLADGTPLALYENKILTNA